MENNAIYEKMSNILKNGITLPSGIECRVMNSTLITRYINSIRTLDSISANLDFDNSIKYADEQYLMKLICNQLADNIVLAYNKGDKDLLLKTNNNIRLETGRLKEVKRELIEVLKGHKYLYSFTFDEALELLSSYFTPEEIDKMCLIPISGRRSINKIVNTTPKYSKSSKKNNNK